MGRFTSLKSKAGPIVVGIAIAALVVLEINGRSPAPVSFKPVTQQSFFGLMSWLFVVALFVERAVEVIISVIRDAGASPLEQACEAAQDKVDEETRVNPGSVADLGEVHRTQAAIAAYRSETKQIALCIGFVLGLFVSLAGVRALDSIVNTVPAANWLFPIADIILTGAIIAGGSDGVHQMVNVFTNFMSAAADKAKPS
jgi:hypothetical protein